MTLRITGGALRGRPLQCPPGEGVRPTGARVREALFSILGQRLDGRRVLDLFAGTGALGVEAGSRGASAVVFVERSTEHLPSLRTNVSLLGDRGRVEVGDAFGALSALAARGEQFELVFLDPPYRQALADRALLQLAGTPSVLATDAVVLVETARGEPVAVPAGLRLDGTRHYGDTALHLFRRSL